MATKALPPLTSLSEAQRTQVLERIALLHPALERVLIANQLTAVTKEVVETAHKNLIIGFE